MARVQVANGRMPRQPVLQFFIANRFCRSSQAMVKSAIIETEKRSAYAKILHALNPTVMPAQAGGQLLELCSLVRMATKVGILF